MGYVFSKIYGDLVTEDGTVMIVYFAWAHLLGRWLARGSCDVFTPDGRHFAIRDLSAPPHDALDEVSRPLVLRGSSAQGDMLLSVSPTHGAFHPASPEPSLAWAVLVGRGACRAMIPGVGELSGEGYVDKVTLSRPTRLLHLDMLHWGRVHAGPYALTYTFLDFADGRRWRAGACWRGVERIDAQEGDVAIDANGIGTVRIGPSVVHLEAARVLHAGSAFGADRMRGTLDRIVARAVGGRTMQTRWLARARVTSTDPPGWAIHERVVMR